MIYCVHITPYDATIYKKKPPDNNNVIVTTTIAIVSAAPGDQFDQCCGD